MATTRTKWNDLLLEGSSTNRINILKKTIRKVQKQHGFVINPEWVKKIRAAKAGKDTTGVFYYNTKTIVIDTDVNWSAKNFYHWFHMVFTHETVHAVDFAYDFQISKIFFPYYLKALKLVYKQTKKEEFKMKLEKDVDYLKYNRFMKFFPADHDADGELNPILYKEGYGYDYCLTDAAEFAAVTMELFFANPSRLNDELFALCQEIKERFFLK
jgi:hypothetical protein